MIGIKAQNIIPDKADITFAFCMTQSGQFITVGNVYSIDLDRFVSASVTPSSILSPSGFNLTIRIRGSGFLRFMKYSNYRVFYETTQEASKDLKMLVDAANKWKNTKQQQLQQLQILQKKT